MSLWDLSRSILILLLSLVFLPTILLVVAHFTHRSHRSLLEEKTGKTDLRLKVSNCGVVAEMQRLLSNENNGHGKSEKQRQDGVLI